MDRFLPALIDFTTLLIFPLLGVLALFGRRALFGLGALAVVWTLAGALCVFGGWTIGAPRERVEHAWLLGVALAAGFLAVAWLKERRAVSRWLKLGTAAATVVVFLRALQLFLAHHA